MSIIRNHVERRSIFAVWMIALLCVIVFVYVQEPRSGAIHWTLQKLYSALDAALNAVASINYVTPSKLNEQIRDLNDDLADMKVKAVKYAAKVTDYTHRYRLALEALDTAAGEFFTARDARDAAVLTESTTKSAYDTALLGEYDAYLLYRRHTLGCYECDNEIYCSTAHSLFDLWQRKKRKLTAAKTAYEDAKKDLKAKKIDAMIQETDFRRMERVFQIWSSKLQRAKSKLWNQRTAITATETELRSKEFKKEKIDALVLVYPDLMAYMDALEAASTAGGFDFETFIEENPIPAFIEEHIDVDFDSLFD